MYFPAAWFIPFIRHVDLCVLEHVNAPSLQQHGPKLLPGSNGFGKKDIYLVSIISRSYTVCFTLFLTLEDSCRSATC